MALSAAAVEEELSCPVCWQLFVDKHSPIVLDCRHDVCDVCLKTLLKDGNVKCPQCRVNTNVPEPDGVAALKPNFRVRNLAEIYSRCQSKDDELCKIHSEERALFVCVSCNVPVCQFCIVHDHQTTGHECKERKDVIKERRQECTDYIRQAREEMQWCDRFLILWTECREKLSKSFENERSNVSKYIRSLIDYVQQRRTEIVCELHHVEQSRLKYIAIKYEKCRQKLDKGNIASGGMHGELSDSQFIDWLEMNTNDLLEKVDPIESLQPDTSRPFNVSMVELGVHPHSIDVKDITKNSCPKKVNKITTTPSYEIPSRSDHNETVGIPCVGVRSRAAQASDKEDVALFSDLKVEETRDEPDDGDGVPNVWSVASAIDPRQYQEAFDAWNELSVKVTASLDDEVAKVSNHSREVVDEITRQGDIMRLQLTEEEHKRITGIDTDSDRCRQRIDKLNTFCDSLSKLTDEEFITEYSRITNDIQEMITDLISYSEKDSDAPTLVCLDGSHDLGNHSLCIGNVLTTKRIYLRKQLMTHFMCDATIVGMDVSPEGNIVVVGYTASTVGSLQVWSNISGVYQRIIATEVSGNDFTTAITGVTIDQVNNRYVVSRKTTLDSYSPLGIYETELLADYASDSNGTLDIQSVATNREGFIMMGDIQTCTIKVLSSDGIKDVIPVPFRPYKMTTYGTNVVYTDVTSNRVHCFNYLSRRDIFIIHVPSPTGLCFDKSTGCLYICATGNRPGCNAIGFYCGISGEVKEERVVSGLGSPQDVCLLQGGKELAVADGNCVNIYCLQ